jgi:hypothetical protein
VTESLAARGSLLLAIAARVVPGDDTGGTALTEASRAIEEEGEPVSIGLALTARSILTRIDGRLDESERLARQALELSQGIGESYVRLMGATQLARVDLKRHRPDEARGHALEGLRAARRMGNLNATSFALELLATAALQQGDADRAARLFAMAERGYHVAGSQPWLSEAEQHAALERDIHAALGDRYAGIEAEVEAGDLDAHIEDVLATGAASPRAAAR